MARSRRAVVGAGLLASLFLVGTVAAPLLGAAQVRGAALLHALYAPLCHQLAARSLTLDGQPLAVCARCCGLYLGGVLGLFAAAAWIVGRRAGPRPVWLAVALAPTVVDAVLAWLGWSVLDNVPRLLLALPAGFVAGLFLAVGIQDLSRHPFRIRTRGPQGARAP